MGAYLAFPHPPSPIHLSSFESDLEQTNAQAPMIPRGALRSHCQPARFEECSMATSIEGAMIANQSYSETSRQAEAIQLSIFMD